MTKYDDASWHYEGEFPQNLLKQRAATHIGMFLAWCIINQLIATNLEDQAAQEINLVKKGIWTGAEFLMKILDEKLTEEDLNTVGNQFAKDYYEEEGTFAQQYGTYMDDYVDVFEQLSENNGIEYDTIYHIEDSWDHFYELEPVMNERWQQWKKYIQKF